MKVNANVTISRKIVLNGVEYHSVDEMPAETRALFEKMLASQVPATLRPLFDEHSAKPADVRVLTDRQGVTAAASGTVDERDSDNATAVRLFLAGLLALGAIAGYFWLRS